jgi:L-lactate dehydrogenase
MHSGIGSIVRSMCTSILKDKRDVRPISNFQPEFGWRLAICCSWTTGKINEIPALIEAKEYEAVRETAKMLKKWIRCRSSIRGTDNP